MQIRTTLCRRLLCLTLLGLARAAIPAEGTPDEVASASSDVPGADLTDPLHYNWWRHERARRAADLQTYLAQHSAAFASFKNEPLAIKQDALNFVGIQMIMFRLFPVIFPDIWGSPSEQMAPVGFGPDPFEPGNIMPLGTGYHLSQSFSLPNGQQSIRVNYATLTCMGCHAGSVTGPNVSVIHFVGGPNPIGNFFALVGQTVNDPRYKPLNFRAAR